ncbi:hypothetical protein EMCRGX_G032178 [Ephydatia muelleri]
MDTQWRDTKLANYNSLDCYCDICKILFPCQWRQFVITLEHHNFSGGSAKKYCRFSMADSSLPSLVLERRTRERCLEQIQLMNQIGKNRKVEIRKSYGVNEGLNLLIYTSRDYKAWCQRAVFILHPYLTVQELDVLLKRVTKNVSSYAPSS